MARICLKTTYDYIIKYHDSVLKKQTNQKRTKIKGKKSQRQSTRRTFSLAFLIALLRIGIQTSHDIPCLMTNTDVPEILNHFELFAITQNEQIIILKH